MKDVVSCDKLRGAATQAMIRRCPNGKTHTVNSGVLLVEHIDELERTQGTETSKYLKEQKIIMIPQVVASERGTAQTLIM